LPGGKVIDSTPEGILKQAQDELREETGFWAAKFEKLLDLYSHPDYIAHKGCHSDSCVTVMLLQPP
jgi:hypothetical protein